VAFTEPFTELSELFTRLAALREQNPETPLLELVARVFGEIGVSSLGTGTATGAKFLRGDGAWADTLLGPQLVVYGPQPSLFLNHDGSFPGLAQSLEVFCDNKDAMGFWDATNNRNIVFFDGTNNRILLGDWGAVALPVISIGGAVLVNSFAASLRTITANATLTNQDCTVLGDATGGAITVTLPTAASAFDGLGAGRIYTVKKVDASANAVTLDGNGAETIDGAATAVLAAQWASVRVQSDGTNWVKI
jgi:hypothetical protein